MTRATAAVFEKLFTPFTIADVEIDAPGPGEALVQIVATGVCHTDAITRDGDLPFPPPGVLGHEGAGVVAAVGDGVTNVAEGDKVVIGWPWCGQCRNCLEGQPRYCLSLGQLVVAGSRPDGTTALRRLDGSPLHSHYFGQSSFATYSICPASSLVPVAADAPVAILGPLACGIGTGAGAVLNALRPPVGSSVVVFGAGAVGLSAVMAARLTGATTIVAVDRLASRLRLARELGATETIEVAAGVDPVAAVHEICGGPADASLECTGVIDVVRQAADSVGMRGTCVLIGGAPAGAGFSLDHMSTLWGKRVIGVLGGEGRSASLIGALIELNKQGRFPYDKLITPFPLSSVNDALEASRAGDVVKPVLQMVDAPRSVRLCQVCATLYMACSRRFDPRGHVKRGRAGFRRAASAAGVRLRGCPGGRCGCARQACHTAARAHLRRRAFRRRSAVADLRVGGRRRRQQHADRALERQEVAEGSRAEPVPGQRRSQRGSRAYR